MKKLSLVLFLFAVAIALHGQDALMDSRRHITVTGSAEVNVQPDAIEIEILLKEHGQKGDKRSLASIEKQFFQILGAHGISEEDVMLGNQHYYWYHWWSYRRDYHKQKLYKVQLDASTDFLTLVQALDYEGVQSLRISKTTSEKLQTLRRDVKIQAIRAAKEKAQYLLESIDEQLGRIIAIEETPRDQNRYYWRGNQHLLSNFVMDAPRQDDASIENLHTIRLRYEVKAVFEIEE